MDTNGMIDVSASTPLELVKAAYALSRPQGLGVIHAVDGPLSEADAQAILDEQPPGGRLVASMDYVHGRACKFTIYRHDEKMWIRGRWFDHSNHRLAQLLEICGIDHEIPE